MTGEDAHRLYFGEFELDTGVPELRRNGDLVELTPAPGRALVLLARNAGRLVFREEFYAHLWPDGGVDVDRALNAHILQIRRVLGERSGENRFIRTHPGRGYRFLPEVTTGSRALEEDAVPEEHSWLVARQAWAAVLGALLIGAGVWWAGSSPGTGRAPVPPLDGPQRVNYLTGLELLDMPSPIRRAEAARHLRQVTTVRPDFAPAQSALAESLIWAGDMEGAGAAARTALALDPSDARAHRALGTSVLVSRWAWVEAEAHLREAVELDAASAESHLALAFLLVSAGRDDEARSSLDRAGALSPVSPTVTGDLGMLYGWLGDHERALELCRRTVEIEPSAGWGHACARKAARALGYEVDAGPSPEPDRAASHFGRAVILAGLGRVGEAVAALEASARAREMAFVASRSVPELDALEGSPRFQRLMRRLFSGLSPRPMGTPWIPTRR